MRRFDYYAAVLAVWLLGIAFGQFFQIGPPLIVQSAALLWIIVVLVKWDTFSFTDIFPEKNERLERACMIAFFGTAIVGSLTSVRPLISIAYLLVAYLTFCITSAIWKCNPHSVQRGLAWFGVLSLPIWALIMAVAGERAMNDERLSSFLGPTAMACSLFGSGAACLVSSRWQIRAAGPMAAVCLIFLTGSRGGLFALVLTVCAFWITLIARSISPAQREMAWRICIGACVLTAVVLPFTYERASDLVVRKLDLHSRYRGLTSGFTGRTVAWRQALYLWKREVLLGVGFRNHELYFVGHEAIRDADVSGIGRGHSSAHNGYLAMLADTGVLGTVPLLLLLIRGFRRNWMLARVWSVGAFFFAYLLGFSFLAIFERYLLNCGNTFSLLMIMGMSIATAGASARVRVVASPSYVQSTGLNRALLRQ